jgi:hypothetical protein
LCDRFDSADYKVVVSRHYLGIINHVINNWGASKQEKLKWQEFFFRRWWKLPETIILSKGLNCIGRMSKNLFDQNVIKEYALVSGKSYWVCNIFVKTRSLCIFADILFEMTLTETKRKHLCILIHNTKRPRYLLLKRGKEFTLGRKW